MISLRLRHIASEAEYIDRAKIVSRQLIALTLLRLRRCFQTF